MVDRADMAVDIEAEHIAAGIRRATAPIPIGAPGECDNCGEDMPRLVDGLCARCRDGRIPMRPEAMRRAASREPTLRPSLVPISVSAPPAAREAPRRPMVALLDGIANLLAEHIEHAERLAAERDAAIERAETAEATLASIKAALGQ